MPATHRLTFDPERYPLARLAAEVLGTDDLAALADHERTRVGRSLTAQDSLRLRALLKATSPDHPLRRTYAALAREVVAREFGRIALTQNPTFRVHLAGTGSVSAWHRDADITSRPDYITCWVPFVDAAGANTLWVARDYDAGPDDAEPIAVRHGEILLFDGALLAHGSVPNTTPVTRVSMDFRFALDGLRGAERLFPGRPTWTAAPAPAGA